MRQKKISENAKSRYYDLLRDTMEKAAKVGNTDWKWANMPMGKETKNLVSDMHCLADSKRCKDVTLLEKGLASYTPLDIHDIILRYLRDRLSTYNY